MSRKWQNCPVTPLGEGQGPRLESMQGSGSLPVAPQPLLEITHAPQLSINTKPPTPEPPVQCRQFNALHPITGSHCPPRGPLPRVPFTGAPVCTRTHPQSAPPFPTPMPRIWRDCLFTSGTWRKTEERTSCEREEAQSEKEVLLL